MPTYEYECTCCPTRFELKRSFYDETQVICPECGGRTVRVFTPVPIIFRGSGFYVTDSRGTESHALGGNSKEKDEAKSGTKEESD